jgi:P-type E1-E2 ATPase
MWEGISILVSAIMLIVITSLADLMKDKQFVALQAEILEETVTVLRGKLGSTSTQSVWNLVVGDVILLEGGARVPADCLVIESDDLEVDEDETRNDSD